MQKVRDTRDKKNIIKTAEESDILTECVFPRILAGMLTPRLDRGVFFYRLRCIIEKLQPAPAEGLTLEVIPDSSITHYVGDTVTLRGTLTRNSKPVSGAPIVVYWWVGTPNYNNVAGTDVTDASGNYNISWTIPQEVLSNSEAIVSLQALSVE